MVESNKAAEVSSMKAEEEEEAESSAEEDPETSSGLVGWVYCPLCQCSRAVSEENSKLFQM